MSKRQIFQKVVQWEDGKNPFMALIYFMLIIISSIIMEQVFWKEISVIVMLVIAGQLIDSWSLPKRRVYWVKITASAENSRGKK